MAQDSHQFFSVSDKEGIQIVPLMQTRDERANFAVVGLVVGEKLKFVSAMKREQTVTTQALRA